jgi:Zn-dependent protease
MTFAIVLLGWIFSLCLHEFFHAVTAYYGGDTTVKDKGYLTFNPLKYTHPLYSLVLPLVFLMMGGIGLPGGAVYIETWRLKSRTWQSVVALAGPLANLLMAIILAIVLQFLPWDSLDNNSPVPGIAFLALLQISALVLNLLPLPPFDGYGILEPFLSEQTRTWINSMRTFIMLAVFLALWNIPAVNEMFWTQVYRISYLLGIPFDLAWDGFTRFRFWML